MKQINGYIVTDKTLNSWTNKLIPNYDLFFFEEKPNYFPAESFDTNQKNNFSRDDGTSFETWNVNNKAKFFARITNAAYLKMSLEHRQTVIWQQWLLGRGMVFKESEILSLLSGLIEEEILPTSKLLNENSAFDPVAKEKILLIQGHSWKRFSSNVKIQFLLNYAGLWVDDHALLKSLDEKEQESLNKEFPVLFPFFDSFPSSNGSNCLAAVITAVTNNSNFISEWMQPDRFLKLLHDSNYLKAKTHSVKKQDVLVWKSSDNKPVHSAFALNDRLLFNKHGQTMFNPWQILNISEVLRSWNDDKLQLEVYRK